MCGILGIFGINNANKYRNEILELSKLMRHRGPDWSGIYLSDINKTVLGISDNKAVSTNLSCLSTSDIHFQPKSSFHKSSN